MSQLMEFILSSNIYFPSPHRTFFPFILLLSLYCIVFFCVFPTGVNNRGQFALAIYATCRKRKKKYVAGSKTETKQKKENNKGRSRRNFSVDSSNQFWCMGYYVWKDDRNEFSLVCLCLYICWDRQFKKEHTKFHAKENESQLATSKTSKFVIACHSID